MKKIFFIVLSCFMMAQVYSQCQIGIETSEANPHVTSANDCAWQTDVTLGAGAYVNFQFPTFTHWQFQVLGGNTATINETRVCDGGSNFAEIYNWWSGGGTTNSLGTLRDVGTWNFSSATLQYRLAPPTVTITNGAGPINTCSGTVDLNEVHTYDGNNAVFWSRTAGSGSINSSSGLVTGIPVNSSGTFRARSQNGNCIADDVITVFNRTPTTPTVSGGGTFCSSRTITASGSAANGGFNYYFQGTNSNGTSTANAGATETVTSSGTYYFRARSTVGGCWSASSSVTVTIQTPPTAPTSITGTTTICTGTSTTLTRSGGTDGSGATYQWYAGGCGSGSVLGTGPSLSVSPVSTTTYFVRRVGNTSCTNTTACASVTVTVTPNAAVASVSGSSPLCIGATATYSASGVVLGGGSGAWSSSNTGVATVNASTGVVSGVAAGTANIIYTITGGCGGTQSAQQSVTVLAAPAITSVTGLSPLCISQTTTYVTTGVVLGGGTGAWSSSDPSVATVDAVGLVTGVSAGSADIIYTVTSSCGVQSAQQTVNILPDAAVASVTGTSPLCLSGTATYTATGVELSGGTGLWSSSNALVATVDALTGVVTPVGAGTANIVYTITGGCNGTPTAQQAVTVTSAGTNAVLVSGSTVSAVEACVEAPWTYYANASTPDEYIFAIRKNGNTFVANVEITDQSGTATYSSTGGAGPDRGTFLIGRYWNVTLASGSVVNPVDIRFFVDPAEVTQAQNEANAFQGTTAFATTVVGLSFFKTVGTAYSPGMMGAGNFNFTPEYLAHSTGTLNGVTYYELTGLTSFSGGTGGFSVNDDGSTLPVELLSWEANAIDNQYIDLTWSTATEINNDGFEIQRSTDGENFAALAWEAGNGNSTVVRNYNYRDVEVTKGVRYYYRLKQIDNDGTSETFEIVSAMLSGKGGGFIGNLVPNPSKENGFVSVAISNEVEEAVTVSIYNHVGARVANYQEIISAGNNNLQININDLSSGTYFVNFVGSFGTETRKLVLIK